MNIGENISKLRKENNLTQVELAKLMNVSPKTISSWENNRNLPDINMLIELANIFNVSIDNILNIDKENTNELKKKYQKKDFKDNIFKILVIGLFCIIPTIFFIFIGYSTISAYNARLFAFGNIDSEMAKLIVETSKMVLFLYKDYMLRYSIYLLIILINYIFYKKNRIKLLLAFNTIFLSIYSFSYLEFSLYHLIIIVIEILLFKKDKLFKIFNYILGIIHIIVLGNLLINYGYDRTIYLFIIANIIGFVFYAILSKRNNRIEN